jgi:hypothetical protein
MYIKLIYGIKTADWELRVPVQGTVFTVFFATKNGCHYYEKKQALKFLNFLVISL